ncbi:MAG: retroviral-like aspartic protease family protein [Deltaproteobacteria bacterium]|nr:retroviral-like aspartic protease family protein [Deltaproteobacteria bacterium]
MRQRLEIPIILRRVRLEGPSASREVDMLLDTGAAYTAISWEVAKDLGYDPAGSPERVSIVTANGVIEVPKLVVKRVAFRELAVRQVEVICLDIPELAEIEGLVGLSFLKHFRVLVDFKRGILEIK